MCLFLRKPENVVLVLSSDEPRLAVRALMWWRNKLLQQSKPTENVNEMLLNIIPK